jgi:hypothetical protein
VFVSKELFKIEKPDFKKQAHMLAHRYEVSAFTDVEWLEGTLEKQFGEIWDKAIRFENERCNEILQKYGDFKLPRPEQGKSTT